MAVWEQEFREFRWLIRQLRLANESGDERKIAKATEKVNRWREAHPEAYKEIGTLIIEEGVGAKIPIKVRRDGRY